jgi:DNA-binding NarL/FixJ family response regulator
VSGACGADHRRTIRVLVADDHAAIRAGLTMILDGAPDIEVVAEASDGAAAVRKAAALRPDVVLMDVRMPGTDGLAATRQVIEAGSAQVIVLTTFDMDEYVYGAMRAGAAGFLLKSVDAPRLVESIRLVAAGDGVIEPSVTRRLMSAFASAPAPVAPPELSALTQRERDVLECLGEGLSNQQIARRLGVGEATVKTHVSRVLTKLDLRSRVQAAVLAKDAGVVG